MKSNNAPPYYLYSNTAFKYQKHLNDLVAPSWLVDTLKHHLNGDFGRPQTKLEGSQLVQDPVRSGRGRRASWRCGFQARSLRSVPTAAARVVGHNDGQENYLYITINYSLGIPFSHFSYFRNALRIVLKYILHLIHH
jgi:hypothetical protein